MEDEDSSLLSAQAQSSVTMKKQFRKRHSNKQASNASDASNKLGGPPMSREERKNEQIIKMIERQDKLNMRREKKKQGLQIPNGRDSAREFEPKRGIPNVMAQTSKVTQTKPQAQGPAVEIFVQFADNMVHNDRSNRFFYERKKTIEEKQRMDYEQQWKKMTFQSYGNSISQNNPLYMIRHAQEFAAESQSGSASYVSSSSKRQRLNDDCFNKNGFIPGPQFLVSHSVPMMSMSNDRHHEGPFQKMPNGCNGEVRNQHGPHFITSVSEECASVENLEQVNEVLDSSDGKKIESNPQEEMLRQVLAATRQMQQRLDKKLLSDETNHNSKTGQPASQNPELVYS